VSSSHSSKSGVATLIMCGFKGRHFVISSSYHTNISFTLVHIFITLHTCLGLPHLIVVHFLQCQCDHTVDNLGTHLLWCLCRSERTVAHDTLWDIIATIVLDSGTHV
jgi:hypothetical protein